MRSRELFGLGVRIIGFWFLTQAAYWAYWAALKSWVPDAGNHLVSVKQDVANATIYALLCVFVLGGARAWVWFAYGDSWKPTDAGSDSAAA